MRQASLVKAQLFILVFFAVTLFTLVSNTYAGNSPVKFIIRLDKRAFSQKAKIQVRVFNQAQQKIMDATAKCTVSYDMKTRTQRRQCPPGVTDRKAQPEVFNFPVRDVSAEIEFVSHSVNVGENYRINISGKASDDCNTVSISAPGVATSAVVKLGNLTWAKTQLACPHMDVPSPGPGNLPEDDIKERIPKKIKDQVSGNGGGQSRPGFTGWGAGQDSGREPR